MQLTVKFYGGAAVAAGADARQVSLRDEATLGDLRVLLSQDHPELARVLDVSSLLIDGVLGVDNDRLAEAVRVDVLPPFAGG